jgi:electron transfer flavoprotein beta subunit
MELPKGRLRGALPVNLTLFYRIFMKILVLIKSVLDTKIPLECFEETGRLKDDWNVSLLNPDDGMAIADALQIKKNIPEAHITVIHLGPPSGDRFIREALALGCDEGLRIWDEGLEDLHTRSKLLIFARVAKILGFDILFTGTKSLDTGSSQLGTLLASSLQVPCITHVVRIDGIQTETITVTRKLERGYQERVEAVRPLIISVEADEDAAVAAPIAAIAQAAEKKIPCFDLPHIGIPLQAVHQEESRLKFGPLRLPEPMLQFIQPPDSSLPAFDRRRQIGEGTLQKRQSRMVRGNEDAVVDELFQTLLREGYLGPANDPDSL